MFSTCSELTPRAPIPDGRMERIMQPWDQPSTAEWLWSQATRLVVSFWLKPQAAKKISPEEFRFCSFRRDKQGQNNFLKVKLSIYFFLWSADHNSYRKCNSSPKQLDSLNIWKGKILKTKDLKTATKKGHNVCLINQKGRLLSRAQLSDHQ